MKGTSTKSWKALRAYLILERLRISGKVEDIFGKVENISRKLENIFGKVENTSRKVENIFGKVDNISGKVVNISKKLDNISGKLRIYLEMFPVLALTLQLWVRMLILIIRAKLSTIQRIIQLLCWRQITALLLFRCIV